jgi:hypothetical protein
MVRPQSAKPIIRVHQGEKSKDDKIKRPVSRQSKPRQRVTIKREDSLSSYPEEKSQSKEMPPWEMLSTAEATPPRSLTVTSVKQSSELQVEKTWFTIL